MSRRRQVRVGRLPKGTEARVCWLLAFSRIPLAQVSRPGWRTMWDGLWLTQSGQPVRVGPPADSRRVIAETQEALRDCVEALARGRTATFMAPSLQWVFRPPRRRSPGARTSEKIARWSELNLNWRALPVAVVFRFIDLLDEVGADRLRACPLPITGRECGELFLARRRQVYCSSAHARRAAWEAYLARGADVQRKLSR
jgi:hypothetical protein